MSEKQERVKNKITVTTIPQRGDNRCSFLGMLPRFSFTHGYVHTGVLEFLLSVHLHIPFPGFSHLPHLDASRSQMSPCSALPRLGEVVHNSSGQKENLVCTTDLSVVDTTDEYRVGTGAHHTHHQLTPASSRTLLVVWWPLVFSRDGQSGHTCGPTASNQDPDKQICSPRFICSFTPDI